MITRVAHTRIACVWGESLDTHVTLTARVIRMYVSYKLGTFLMVSRSRHRQRYRVCFCVSLGSSAVFTSVEVRGCRQVFEIAKEFW